MELIKKSVQLSWKNLILIVPFLIEAALGIAGVVIGFILLLLFGFLTFESLEDNFSNLVLPIFIFLILFIVGYYLIHSFVLSGTLGMIKDVLEGKEVKMSAFFAYGKQYVWKAFLIQFITNLLVLILSVPIYMFYMGNRIPAWDGSTFPIGVVVSFVLYLLVSAVLTLVGQFSILAVIRDETSVGKAIKISFKVMTKGVVDCFVLLGIGILLLIPLVIVFIVLNLIPVVGSFAFMAVQYFCMVVLLVWTVLFYDKYKNY